MSDRAYSYAATVIFLSESWSETPYQSLINALLYNSSYEDNSYNNLPTCIVIFYHCDYNTEFWIPDICYYLHFFYKAY